MSLRTHLAVLQESASLFPNAAAFKIPDVDRAEGKRQRWTTVTYRQFLADVELSARYWRGIFEAKEISKRSVIGIWLSGLSYVDTVHIFGIARADFVPQLFSLRLPNPTVIYELMQKAGARALIYDASFEDVVSKCPVPTAIAADPRSETSHNSYLPPIAAPGKADEIAMIFHTSGSTSGSPKLVPCTYRWLDAIIAKARSISVPCRPGRQDVIVWMGSMCHIGQTLTLIGGLEHGTCVVQPTQIAFSSDELIDMVQLCGLNRLTQFATFLGGHLRNAREHPTLLALLQGLDEVLHAGLPLAHAEEEWALSNGILLRNLFGNTECGAMLRSIGGRGQDSSYLRPIESTKYEFRPVTSAEVEAEAGPHNPNSRLLELVILSESGDCPHPSLRHTDGHFHTGDLFIEVAPGCYRFRGRNDDWIKSENSLRCDTKAIEDNVRTTCPDLVAECVVVGNGRPSPVLFVEPKGGLDDEKLKKDIIRRTRHFNSRRYLHERIMSTRFVVVVPRNTLPRTATKGNIRRRAVEEAYKVELDRIYGVTSAL